MNFKFLIQTYFLSYFIAVNFINFTNLKIRIKEAKMFNK